MAHLVAMLEALEQNALVVKNACEKAGADCLFVFKEAPLHPELARSIMEAGGISRLGTLAWPDCDMRAPGAAYLHHIAAPAVSPASDLKAFDSFHVSSLHSLRLLHSIHRGARPGLRISLECGDGRDGFLAEELPAFCDEAARLGFPLLGLSLNFACLSTHAPRLEDLEYAAQVLQLLREYSPKADISAGGTDILELAACAPLPDTVREIRCGSGIMLGIYPLSGTPIPGARQDTFVLEAEVLECRIKQGRKLAVMDFGVFHTDCSQLTAPFAGMTFRGASSVYCVFDVTDAVQPVREGQTIPFRLTFRSLAKALVSRALPVKMVSSF